MLLIQVTYTMRPGQREAFVRKIRESGILDAIRGEDGCLGYSYYLPEEEDGTLLLIEKWTGAPAQKAHLETPHMKQMAAFKPEYVADTKLISCTIPE
ncbi:putative quinol monooxygenase [Pseudoflavonifractor capillosus]|uniref:putative quinol monooxygenase n=1 Tax=Pseudoflavonifractor capillosus TaxID=106588 RepID=UPI00195C5C6C|nr:putative quinol monooxygenase [Pseudoflavonifractor capillosus]MBM6680376.1 antibiotic biosynthesis monooxygenase [Pseudoflavonifractor capillosus]